MMNDRVRRESAGLPPREQDAHPLKRLRLANEWSVEELAWHLNASVNTILGWEAGVVVREGRIPQLARLFDIEPAELRLRIADWQSRQGR
jgi:DNA-binding transcriptional regulator YiaG